MKKLVLIDGNAIIHRAYHALPVTLTDRLNEPINAVYGFTNILLRVIADLRPTHIAVAFDLPEPTFRHREFEDYQAQRPEADPELKGQFAKVREVVKAFGLPIHEQKGFEADDIIGTFASHADKFDEVLIVTGDRDILQLVTDKVKLYMPTHGLSEGKIYGEEETIERMGVAPSQIVDYKALVGDPSDNYKGVPGIGPKTAEKLLGEYRTLDNIYKHIEDLPKAVAEKLKENKDSAYQSQKLAKIVTDMKIDFDIEKWNKWQIDSPEVMGIFEQYGFKSLPKRAKQLAAEMVGENQLTLM